MSDYVYKKVIRYPITTEYIQSLNIPQVYDLYDYLSQPRFKSITCNYNKDKDYFDSESTIDYYNKDWKKHEFLDYILEYEYGSERGYFGRSRYLSEKEKDKWVEIFKQIIPEIDRDKLRVVEYCYYNSSEPQTYYEVKPITDPFYKEI